jgi:gas vesicle protein
MKNSRKIETFMIGIFIGGLIGSITSLLFAPTSGKKLRKKISKKADDFVENAEELYKSGLEKSEELLKEGRKKASAIVDDAKKIVKN